MSDSIESEKDLYADDIASMSSAQYFAELRAIIESVPSVSKSQKECHIRSASWEGEDKDRCGCSDASLRIAEQSIQQLKTISLHLAGKVASARQSHSQDVEALEEKLNLSQQEIASQKQRLEEFYEAYLSMEERNSQQQRLNAELERQCDRYIQKLSTLCEAIETTNNIQNGPCRVCLDRSPTAADTRAFEIEEPRIKIIRVSQQEQQQQSYLLLSNTAEIDDNTHYQLNESTESNASYQPHWLHSATTRAFQAAPLSSSYQENDANFQDQPNSQIQSNTMNESILEERIIPFAQTDTTAVAPVLDYSKSERTEEVRNATAALTITAGMNKQNPQLFCYENIKRGKNELSFSTPLHLKNTDLELSHIQFMSPCSSAQHSDNKKILLTSIHAHPAVTSLREQLLTLNGQDEFEKSVKSPDERTPRESNQESNLVSPDYLVSRSMPSEAISTPWNDQQDQSKGTLQEIKGSREVTPLQQQQQILQNQTQSTLEPLRRLDDLLSRSEVHQKPLDSGKRYSSPYVQGRETHQGNLSHEKGKRKLATGSFLKENNYSEIEQKRANVQTHNFADYYIEGDSTVPSILAENLQHDKLGEIDFRLCYTLSTTPHFTDFSRTKFTEAATQIAEQNINSSDIYDSINSARLTLTNSECQTDDYTQPATKTQLEQQIQGEEEQRPLQIIPKDDQESTQTALDKTINLTGEISQLQQNNQPIKETPSSELRQVDLTYVQKINRILQFMLKISVIFLLFPICYFFKKKKNND